MTDHEGRPRIVIRPHHEFSPDAFGTFTDHEGRPLTYRQIAALLAAGWRIVIRPTDDHEAGGKELHPP